MARSTAAFGCAELVEQEGQELQAFRRLQAAVSAHHQFGQRQRRGFAGVGEQRLRGRAQGTYRRTGQRRPTISHGERNPIVAPRRLPAGAVRSAASPVSRSRPLIAPVHDTDLPARWHLGSAAIGPRRARVIRCHAPLPCLAVFELSLAPGAGFDVHSVADLDTYLGAIADGRIPLLCR